MNIAKYGYDIFLPLLCLIIVITCGIWVVSAKKIDKYPHITNIICIIT